MLKHLRDTFNVVLPFFVVIFLIFTMMKDSPDNTDCPVNHDCKKWTHPQSVPVEKREEEWNEYKPMVGTPRIFLGDNPAFDMDDQ